MLPPQSHPPLESPRRAFPLESKMFRFLMNYLQNRRLPTPFRAAAGADRTAWRTVTHWPRALPAKQQFTEPILCLPRFERRRCSPDCLESRNALAGGPAARNALAAVSCPPKKVFTKWKNCCRINRRLGYRHITANNSGRLWYPLWG